MSDLNEKELNTWGFTKGLRTGLITFLLAAMMISIVFLFKVVLAEKDSKEAMQKELYEKMLERVDQKMEQPIKSINDVVEKVDTAAMKAARSADKVDSLTTQYSKKRKP